VTIVRAPSRSSALLIGARCIGKSAGLPGWPVIRCPTLHRRLARAGNQKFRPASKKLPMVRSRCTTQCV
jgi:hypothetical protein